MNQANAKRGPQPGDYPERGFWALFVTQFQGAFNDNLYQYLIIFSLAAYLQSSAVDGVVTVYGYVIDAPIGFVQSVAGLLFAVPFIIFAGFFGAIADRFSKQRIAVLTKVWEVGVMGLGGVAFYLGNPILIWAMLFLMATQSAMFGPTKYGILPETIPEAKLSWANGILQMGTLVSIILGTLAAGWLFKPFQDQLYLTSVILIAFSAFGLLTSLFMSKPPAANPSQKVPVPILPWAGMTPYFRAIWRDKVLFNVIIGYVYFWFAGALARFNILTFFTESLDLVETQATVFIGVVTIGIGVGAVVAGYISRNKIELGLIPIGAAGMAIFSLLLGLPASVYEAIIAPPPLANDGSVVLGAYHYMLGFFVFGLGFFAGIFDVPLVANIQQRAPRGMKGGIIAATNMLTFVGMFIASGTYMAFNFMAFDAYQVFLISALMSLVVGLYISIKLPHLFLRSILWFLMNTVLRVKTLNRQNVPELGGALFVTNAASMLDTLAIIASTDRNLRFVVGEEVLKVPWMRRVAEVTRMITYDPNADDREVISKIRTAVAEGDAVCLTTEPALDKNGSAPAFMVDYARILDGLDAPVVPVHLDRLWGSIYRFEGTNIKLLKRKDKPYRIQVNFGAGLSSASSQPEDLRNAIQALGTEAYTQRPLRFELCHRGFIRAARRNLKRMAIADVASGELNYFKTLVGSIAFARKLKQRLDKNEMVGILVPPSVGGILTNVALSMMGRTSVNLNYTASNESIKSCAEQCKLTQVISAKKVLERLPVEIPGEAIFLEDIKDTVTSKDRIIAMLIALFVPVRIIEKMLGAPPRTVDDTATIIFSSGSEGDPKGIMLTHRNVISNLDSVLEVFPHNPSTCLIGYLPLFHSFGYTVTMWMVLSYGMRAIYHTSPLEPKIIGDLSKKYGGSIMIGTSTLLQHFIRRCTTEQFAELDFVVTGAEKLAPRVRIAFKEKFGVEPLEGYGTTECAPAVSVNIPDCVSPGFYYRGTRHGTIGRLFPGQSARVVDPDTEEPLPYGEPGLLLIKGPNIMKGYLNQPEKTAAVLKDGWYATGDIATLSIDGFITITDRLSRFSKIAGEMVPHNKIEDTLHDVLELTEQSLAIASVPDAKKGERLVVLHTLDETQLETLIGKLDQCGLPKLWIPRPNSFYRIDEIPVLGTGKMDLKAVKKMAAAFDLGED